MLHWHVPAEADGRAEAGANRSLRTHCSTKTAQRFGAERQFFIAMFPAEADWRAEAGATGA